MARIRFLFFPERAVAKLMRRGISRVEASQLLRNSHVLAANPHPRAPGGRFLIGRTDGGRVLTLAVYPTHDPALWIVHTGWDATPEQARALDRA